MVRINQLFTRVPPPELVTRLLLLLGLQGPHDNRAFTKYDLRRMRSIERADEVMIELERYYLPCKYKLYCSLQLEEKSLITVVRQCTRLYGCHLQAKEHNMGKKKVVVYRLMQDGAHEGMRVARTPQTIAFD